MNGRGGTRLSVMKICDMRLIKCVYLGLGFGREAGLGGTNVGHDVAKRASSVVDGMEAGERLTARKIATLPFSGEPLCAASSTAAGYTREQMASLPSHRPAFTSTWEETYPDDDIISVHQFCCIALR